MPLPVLPMRPIFVEKLWGGSRLAALPAKARAGHAPPAGRIGESWEVADLPEGTSVVDSGPLAGMTLREVVAAHGHAIAGERTPVSADGVLRFPLLVKLIDADDDLSVQVHPGAAWAATHPGTFSKDEAWLVVDAAPDARVLHGVREGVTQEGFADAIRAGKADTLLRTVRAAAGDLLHIPPGTLHAVGRGCLLLEVQEPSDTTFRVFDFNRVDKDGRPRALHIEQALAVANFGAQPRPAVGPASAHGAELTAARFSLRVQDVSGATHHVKAATPLVLFALDDECTVLQPDLPAAPTTTLPRGGTCIVPPDVRVTVRGGARAHVAVMAPRP